MLTQAHTCAFSGNAHGDGARKMAQSHRRRMLPSISPAKSHASAVPTDMGVSPSEGLAFIQEIEQAPHLFLPYQPEGTSGLARRLNPDIHYIACRWEYVGDQTLFDA